MKLAITYYGGNRHKLWSGTFDKIEQCLSAYKEISLEWLCIVPKISWLTHKLLIAYCRFFFYGDGICREKQIYGRVWRKALREIKNSQADWILMIAEHCLNEHFPTDKRYACYIDTDFPVMAQTSPIKDRPGFDFYLRNYDKYTQYSYNRMNIVFTQNEWTSLSIIKRFNLPKDRVHNVHFGVNVEPYYGEKNYDNNLMLIVLREYNHQVKGLDLIVEALPLIRKDFPTASLAVVGNNIYAGKEGVNCYVGYPREKTQELFRKAALYVMPSRNEPNGITYLEALANRTPFVALNRYATPEFSGYGTWSFLCDTETPEAIAQMVCTALSDKQRLAQMGEKGQRFVTESYTWKKTIEKMIYIMNEYEQSENQYHNSYL